jgi:SAM-dependent methyltransferase
MSSINPTAAGGFERGADDYEAARPGYPDALFSLLAAQAGLGPGVDVLDLAAGTGKLTEGLVAREAKVVAVEPVAAMRAKLIGAFPQVDARDGTAEALPVDDDSIDLVTVGQAFHWFDPQPALAEIHRVLRPGGALALVWNVKDESVAWVHATTELTIEAGGGRPYEREQDWAGEVAAHGGFSPLIEARLPHPQEVDVETVLRRAASTSYVSVLPDAERGRVLDEIRDLLATDPDTRGRATFAFPYDTDVLWCRAQ